MANDEYVGMRVHLVEDREIPIEYIPGCRESVGYTTSDTFTVEHDFRETEESGIRVGMPGDAWMALTSEQFAEMFGDDALAELDHA